MRVSVNDYKNTVKIVVVPERDDYESTDHGVKGEVKFWIHTYGLHKYDRPEMELRNVPALHVGDAGSYLNSWGLFAVNDRPLEEGSEINSGEPILVALKATKSTDPFWEKRKLVCMTLDVVETAVICDVDHDEQIDNIKYDKNGKYIN